MACLSADKVHRHGNPRAAVCLQRLLHRLPLPQRRSLPRIQPLVAVDLKVVALVVDDLRSGRRRTVKLEQAVRKLACPHRVLRSRRVRPGGSGGLSGAARGVGVRPCGGAGLGRSGDGFRERAAAERAGSAVAHESEA